MVLSMSKKKVFLLLISLVFMMSLFANAVSAAEDNFLPEVIEDWATFLFVDLANMADSSDDAFIIYSKFLFFWLVFAVLFFGASKVFPDNKNITVTVSIILSLITIVMIPRSMMLFIFESYSVVISFVFGFLPFFIGFMLAHRVASGDEPGKKVLRGIIYVFMGIFTVSFVGVLSGFEGPLYVQLAKWTAVGGWVALVIGIWTLATSGKGGAGGGSGWNPFSKGGTPEERAERREEAEIKKGEKQEEMEVAADAAIMKLNSEMGQIEEKLEQSEFKEMEEISKELKTYEQHEKILAELKRLLLGTWNIDAAIGNVMRNLKGTSKDYRERQMPDVREKVDAYKNFVARLINIFTALEKSLENLKNREEYMEKLEKFDKRLVGLLAKHGRLELKDLRVLVRLDTKEKTETTKITNLENEMKKIPQGPLTAKEQTASNKIKSDLDTMKQFRTKREQLLTQEFNVIKRDIKANTKIRRFINEGMGKLKELEKLDDQDIKTCEKTIKFMTRYSSAAVGSERWMRLMLVDISKVLFLRNRDIRSLNESVGDIGRHTIEKIRLSGEFKEIDVKKRKLTDFEKKVNGYISQAEKYAEAEDIAKLNKLEEAKKNAATRKASKKQSK